MGFNVVPFLIGFADLVQSFNVATLGTWISSTVLWQQYSSGSQNLCDVQVLHIAKLTAPDPIVQRISQKIYTPYIPEGLKI